MIFSRNPDFQPEIPLSGPPAATAAAPRNFVAAAAVSLIFALVLGCATADKSGEGIRIGVSDFAETGTPASLRHLKLGETAAAVAASVFSSCEGVKLVLAREVLDKKLTAWELLSRTPEQPIDAEEGIAATVVNGEIDFKGSEMNVSAVVESEGGSIRIGVKGPAGTQEQARSLFEELSLRILEKLKPRDPEILARLGIALREAGLVSGAIEKYKEAIAISPGYAAAHYNLGVAFDASGDVDSAVESYKRALEINPGHAAAGYNLALDELRQRGPSESDAEFSARVSRGEKTLKKVLESNPRSKEARLLLIDSMIIAGRLGEALEEAFRFQKIHTDDGRGFEIAGSVLLRMGRFEDALAEFGKLNEMEPALLTTIYFIGIALEGAGRIGEAIDSYREFLVRTGSDQRFESARKDALERIAAIEKK